MLCFIATLRVKAGQEGNFERLQTELSELTHDAEPDTLVYDVLRHRDQPGVYVVYAESQPRSRTNLVRGEYSTQSYSFGRSSRITTTVIPTATTSASVTTPPTTQPETATSAETLAMATSATPAQGVPGFAIPASMAAFGAAAILLWRRTRG
jgi:hypothetical protein